MGLPRSRAAHALRAALVLLVLSAPPAHAEAWSARDVEAAARYRAEERARAERYRAGLERAPAAPREPARRTAAGARLEERLSDWVRARLGAFIADLVAALEGWLARQLEALAEVFEEPPPRNELRRPEQARDPLGAWLAREEARARRLLEAHEAKGARRPDPALERDWAEREAARGRAWSKRRTARERAAPGAPWEARWREAESWERIERERLERR
jgi:hypothetical protein